MHERKDINLNQKLTHEIDMDEPCPQAPKTWLQKGQEELPKEATKERFRKHKMSEQSQQLIGDRGNARKHRKLEEFEKLTKEFRKLRKQDRKKRVLEGLTKELGVRDKWMGIRELRTNTIPSLSTTKTKKENTYNGKTERNKQQNI